VCAPASSNFTNGVAMTWSPCTSHAAFKSLPKALARRDRG
jgi:hypothetical protein